MDKIHWWQWSIIFSVFFVGSIPGLNRFLNKITYYKLMSYDLGGPNVFISILLSLLITLLLIFLLVRKERPKVLWGFSIISFLVMWAIYFNPIGSTVYPFLPSYFILT